jgi:hypothetical protein
VKSCYEFGMKPSGCEHSVASLVTTLGMRGKIENYESLEPPVCSGVPRCYKNRTRSGGEIWTSAYLRPAKRMSAA